jgi:hypothetical protein
VRHQSAASALAPSGIAWFVGTREWLARFPLSIIQLAGRIGVGATFFKAGLLKYQSWEFTVRLFQEEYRVPLPVQDLISDNRCRPNRTNRAYTLVDNHSRATKLASGSPQRSPCHRANRSKIFANAASSPRTRR